MPISISDDDATPKTGVFLAIRDPSKKTPDALGPSISSLDCVAESALVFPARSRHPRTHHHGGVSGCERRDARRTITTFKRRGGGGCEETSSDESSLASPPPAPQILVAPPCAPAPVTRRAAAASAPPSAPAVPPAVKTDDAARRAEQALADELEARFQLAARARENPCLCCQAQPRSVLLRPCMHVALCGVCEESLRLQSRSNQPPTCPVCRVAYDAVEPWRPDDIDAEFEAVFV